MSSNKISAITLNGHPPIGLFEGDSHVVLFNIPSLAGLHKSGTSSLFPREARGASTALAEQIKDRVEARLGRELFRRELVVVHFEQDAAGGVKVAEQNLWVFDPDFSTERLDGAFMPTEDLMDRLLLRPSRATRAASPLLPEHVAGDFARILGVQGAEGYVGMLILGRCSFPIASEKALRDLADLGSYEQVSPDTLSLQIGAASVHLSAQEVATLAAAADQALKDYVLRAYESSPVRDAAGAHQVLTDLERFSLAATHIQLLQQAGVEMTPDDLPDADVTREALDDLSRLMLVSEVGSFIAQTPQVAAAVFTSSALTAVAHHVGRARESSRHGPNAR